MAARYTRSAVWFLLLAVLSTVAGDSGVLTPPSAFWIMVFGLGVYAPVSVWLAWLAMQARKKGRQFEAEAALSAFRNKFEAFDAVRQPGSCSVENETRSELIQLAARNVAIYRDSRQNSKFRAQLSELVASFRSRRTASKLGHGEVR